MAKRRSFSLLELLLVMLLLITVSTPVGRLAKSAFQAQQLSTAMEKLESLLQEFQLYALACRGEMHLLFTDRQNSLICTVASDEAAPFLPHSPYRLASNLSLHVNGSPCRDLHLLIDDEGMVWQIGAAGEEEVTSLSLQRGGQQLHLSLRVPLAPRKVLEVTSKKST